MMMTAAPPTADPITSTTTTTIPAPVPSIAAPVPSSSSTPFPPARSASAHHRLYEFAKTALIKIFVYPNATVCDLYCGPGSDLDKWDDATIGHFIGIDEAPSGISDARELWESELRSCNAEFCEFDPSVEDLKSKLQDKKIPVNIVGCLQHLQVCFKSEEKAKSLLQNVADLLQPGGYFFGITLDSSTIWTKYQKNVEASHNKGLKPNAVPNCIRSENYVITFEVEEEKFPLFGKKCQLKFSDETASETHFLVHFPSMIRLARDAGLEFIEIQNLTEFYDDNRAQFAGILHSYGPNFVDPRGRLLVRAFDILGLYSTFIFQKPDPEIVPPIFPPDEDPMYEYEEHEWQENLRHAASSADEEKTGGTDSMSVEPLNNEKGILGPGPADLRFPEPFKGGQYPPNPDESSW